MRHDIKKRLYKFIKNNDVYFLKKVLLDKTTHSQSHTSNKKTTTRINFYAEVLNKEKISTALTDYDIIESDDIFIGWDNYSNGIPHLCISITK